MYPTSNYPHQIRSTGTPWPTPTISGFPTTTYGTPVDAEQQRRQREFLFELAGGVIVGAVAIGFAVLVGKALR